MDQGEEDPVLADINLHRMMESRIAEIVQIEKEIKRKYPKQFQQRLPRFMRRRAASHNSKRIPGSAKGPNRTFGRLKFRKTKRILEHQRKRHKFKDPNKSLLHIWFAKRFKMGPSTKTGLEHVPLHNNTKNQRNLYRQTRSGCAYLSFIHLNAIKVNLAHDDPQALELLNKLTLSISGFTFSARCLELGKYEAAIHLFRCSNQDQDAQKSQRYRDYICPALVSNHTSHFILWVPREKLSIVGEQMQTLSIPHELIDPRDCVRIRLLGPGSRDESLRMASDKEILLSAIEDVDKRLMRSYKFGCSVGRFIIDNEIQFIYYQTSPYAVDMVFGGSRGRMLWHTLIKNKAHLAGGKRDVDVLLTDECFKLEPDFKLTPPNPSD